MTSRIAIAFALANGLLFTSCSLVDIVRAQKRAPVRPDVDFTSIGPIAIKVSPDDVPVEKKFKNIKVLQGLPSSQLYPVMSLIANSLGVTCAHCHTEYFEEESRNEKQMARQMIRMVRGINRAQFQGEPTVTCYTCHRGSEYPRSAPEIAQAGWQQMLRPKAPPPPLPDLESVLARYDAAMGGKEDVELPRGSGEISLVGGLNERVSSHFELVPGARGTVEIRTDIEFPPQLEKALARYRFGRLNLKRMYDDKNVMRQQKVDGSDAVIVTAQPNDDPPERLAFDLSSGLLLRVQRGTSTALGYVPEEITFSDYQPLGGVPTPRTVRWGRGDFLVTLHFSEMRSSEGSGS